MADSPTLSTPLRQPPATDVALVGMACIFPGAPDLETYWSNITAGVDAITEVPASRWDPLYYDPSSKEPDRFYCKRGGFIDEFARFDALGFGVMPVAAAGAEPDQLLTLEVAARALADAGYAGREIPSERTGVILGRGNYIGAGMTRLEQHVRTAEQLVLSLRTLVPGLSEGQLRAVKAEFQSQLGGYGPDTAIGLVPNLTASRVANRLNLRGPAYTVDAACASSLVALDQACRDLREHRADLMLCGGVHLSHDVAFWSVFCQLGALSRTEQIRPFDRDADGLLVGEGLGVVVLKRLEDAQRDADRIYAIIRGVGTSSDGREASLMQPGVDGQLLALRRAWDIAGLDPARLGLVEAHGTGTVVGDEAELTTLGRFFGTEGQRAGIGSVKSMIGHTMPASGIAALIKAALAVYHQVLPPTLHCQNPRAAFAQTRFEPIAELKAWHSADGQPLVAGVEAFGFGGVNGHVVLEGAAPPKRDAGARVVPGWQREAILLLSADSNEALAEALRSETASQTGGPCRLALVNPTPARRQKALKAVESGRARAGRDGLWYSPKGLLAAGGKVAFMFPGVEAVFEPQVRDVARHFRKPVRMQAEGSAIERQGADIVMIGRLLFEVLGELRITPDVVCGHSVGEWTAMITAEMIPRETLDDFLGGLRPDSLDVPGVVFAACGTSAARVSALLPEGSAVRVTHDNCPHQCILCGPKVEVQAVLAALKEAKVLGQLLPFRSGFHSPIFADFVGPHRARLEGLALTSPKVPLWSGTTAAPFPESREAMTALAVRHLVEPVRFRELTEALYADGVRAFVQIGTGSLVGFVADTLRGRAHLAISTTASQRSGMAQLRRLCAALFVEGLDVQHARLEPGAGSGRRRMPLQLGVPLVALETPLELGGMTPKRLPVKGPAAHPVAREFEAMVQQLSAAQAEVYEAWRGPALGETAAEALAPREARTTRHLSVETDPHLLDHCLLPQPEGWPVLADRNPVVPLTMSLRIMLDAAQRLVPERVPVALEDVRAYKWLQVEPPIDVRIDARFDGRDRVKVALEGFNEGTVVLATAYPEPPTPRPPIPAAPETVPIEDGALYGDRWMFHGPRYQAVTRLLAVTDAGIRGQLQGMSAEGALLDAAGQLFGAWVMFRADQDRLAMPIKIKRLALFGPEPAPGEAVDCTVWIGRMSKREVDCDMELTVGGRLWARVTGWGDWRFETDARLWPVMQKTEHHLYCDVPDEGPLFIDDRGRSEAGRDYLASRFLTAAERQIWDELAPRRKSPWLYGRIAAKDAARHWLWTQAGHGPMFPAEIQVITADRGRPILEGRFSPDLRVSIAHKDDVAVAMVREGEALGVDIERVAARSTRFARLVCTSAELDLLAAQAPGAVPERTTAEARGEEPGLWDEWLTRFWCAKEVIGKMRGTGLEGIPKQFVVTQIDGVRLLVEGRWVKTRRHDAWIIAWTEDA